MLPHMPHTQPPRQLKVPTHVKLSEVIIACKIQIQIQIQYKYNTNSIQKKGGNSPYNVWHFKEFLVGIFAQNIIMTERREDTEAVTCGLYIGCNDSHVYVTK